MKKFNWKKIISILVFFAIVVFLGFYLKTQWPQFNKIHIVSWWSFAGLFILTPISFWVTAFFFRVSLEPYFLKLSFREYFGLTMLTLMGNYTIPFSGLGVRAVYMKKNYNFSYGKFLTIVVANWVTNFLIYSLAGMLALIIYYLRFHIWNWPLSVIFLTVLLFSILTFLPIKTKIKILISWHEYLKDKEIINKLLAITFWQFLATALTFYFAYLAFGFRITFLDSFFATTLSLYSSVIRLVPASLGFYEAAITYPSRVLGFSIADGLAVSAITRAATIFWTFTLGGIFGYILLGKSKVKNQKSKFWKNTLF